MRADLPEPGHDSGNRVPEAVALPHADERDTRPPEFQRLRDVAVHAAMVSDLQHLDGTAPCIERAPLRLLLGIPEQKGEVPVALKQKDHARVVGGQSYIAAPWP